MIPVWQTRLSVESFGNCWEACLASILEVPLAAVPDRADYLPDPDGWADLVQRTRREHGDAAVGELDWPFNYADWTTDLRRWLADRGAGWLELLVGRGGVDEATMLDVARDFGGYWIGNVEHDGCLHAVVFEGDRLVHNPMRGGALDRDAFGPLRGADLLLLSNPATLARRLERLPDVAGVAA